MAQKGTPGQRDGVTTTPRNIVKSYTPPPRYIPVTLDATYCYDGSQATGKERRMRAGIPLAKLSTGLWVPVKRTRVNGTSGAVTEVVVDDARFFEVGDVITIGSDTTISITAINYATNTLTIASTTVADNDQVFCEVAGIASARAILNEFVDMVDKDDNTARDRSISHALIEGYVDASMVLGDLDVIRNPDTNDGTHYIDGILFDDESGGA